MPRNMFLFSNAIYLLPYTGVGSGITRALDENINVTFTNNSSAQEFVITVWREESNQVGNEVDIKSNEVEYSDTDLDTRLRHSDTNLDTLTLKECHCLTSRKISSTSVLFLEPQKKYSTE